MDASVTFLLENLKQVALYHINLISSAKNELSMLQDELAILKSKLEDASRVRKKEEAFKEYEKQIRKVVYDAEDTIDTCITLMANEGTSDKILKTNQFKLAREVKALREGPIKKVFDPAMTHFVTLKVADQSKEPEEVDDQAEDRFLSKDPPKIHIVGLKKETDDLVSLLKEKLDRLEVMAIIGMPGLGKTTFAHKVFHHPEILYNFPIRIWVTVSQEFNRRNVLLSILKNFTQVEAYSDESDNELALMVEEKLIKGSFLVVLDDVWTADALDKIKSVFPKGNGVGKVLITTRNEVVASHVMTTRPPYNLRFLDKDESWELLQYGVYDDLHTVNEDLVKLGKIIATNCDGLPLSIVVIAGILRDKIGTSKGSISLIRREWETISVSVKTYLTLDKKGRIPKIIALSYSKLPYDLRDCFLYLGIFPEDYFIPTWELIRLWIAEGFIQPKEGKSLEETARDNLNDLIGRGLVMVQKTKLDGEVKTCSVHDAIHEFCKNKASVAEENLFQEIKKNEKEGVFQPEIGTIKVFRRISIHSYVKPFFLKKPDIPARSFLCFPKEAVNLEAKDIAFVNRAFTLLRVFGAKEIKFPKFPPKMTKLIHLRYLTLSVADELKILPDAIFNLWNLQTLLVETKSRTLEIKGDLWKLMYLRHFKTKAALIIKNLKGTGGENLKTLGRLSPESCGTGDVFTKAKYLQTLGVLGDLSKLLDSNCLSKLEVLNKLKLEHDPYPNSVQEHPLKTLPQYHKFPRTLKVLTLKGTYLKWDQMSILVDLANLEVLKLKDHAFVGESWEIDHGFRKLEFLYIERTNLSFWDAKSPCFPRLRNLTLKSCEALEKVPFILGKKLELLSLERVTKSAVESAIKIEDDKLNDPELRRGGFKLEIGAADKISKS